MSLKVWLPLNGDLKNQGLSKLPATSANSLTYGAGKIGQCATGRVAWHLDEEILGNTWSVAMWVKPASLGANNNVLFCKNISGSTDCQIYFSIISTTQLNIGVNGPSSSVNASGQTFTTGVWYHVAATYDGTMASVYLNGTRLKSGTVTTAMPTGRLNMCINGRSTNAAGTSATGNFDASFNDFRLYDHCLSAAEVKEIAQGLVLHYKLDTYNLFNPNTLTQDIYLLSNGSTSTSGAVDNWALTEYILVKPNTTYIGYNLVNGGNGNPSICYYDINKTYTRGAAITANTPLNITTQNNEYYVRISIRKKNNDIYKMSFLEIPQIIQDSSGYNHNGTIIGSIIPTSDTTRYSTAAYWNCSSPTDNTNTGLCYIQSSFALTTPLQMSITWWAKPESGYGGTTSHAAFCTSNNTSAPTDYNTTAFHHRDSGFDIYPSDASGVKRLSFTYTKNEWHHYAVTYDGTTARTYQDGVLKTSIEVGANKTLASFSQLYIGFSKAGSVWRKTLGSYSDFRVYVTPLLDTDIKQLYNVGMKVDKTQNIHNFELVEKGYNILAATPWCSSYSTHNPITSPFTNFNANGEAQFTANGSSAGTNYLEITPGIYEYDYTISVNTGNKFYIGFERYDANKTSRSNNACIYTYSTKPSTDVIKQRYKGTVDLSTDSTNPLKYIALRILNGWSGTTSDVTGQATIHNFSLRLQSTAVNPKITKAGQLISDEFKEYSSAKFYKDHIIEANQFIER